MDAPPHGSGPACPARLAPPPQHKPAGGKEGQETAGDHVQPQRPPPRAGHTRQRQARRWRAQPATDRHPPGGRRAPFARDNGSRPAVELRAWSLAGVSSSLVSSSARGGPRLSCPSPLDVPPTRDGYPRLSTPTPPPQARSRAACPARVAHAPARTWQPYTAVSRVTSPCHDARDAGVVRPGRCARLSPVAGGTGWSWAGRMTRNTRDGDAARGRLGGVDRRRRAIRRPWAVVTSLTATAATAAAATAVIGDIRRRGGSRATATRSRADRGLPLPGHGSMCQAPASYTSRRSARRTARRAT